MADEYRHRQGLDRVNGVVITMRRKTGTRAVGGIQDLVKAAFETRAKWSKDHDRNAIIWYRGVSDSRHDLVPGAYRSGGYDEDEYIKDFLSLSMPYLTRPPDDAWDWYYLMQHYGVPTRLLDWTESLLVAAYFAVDGWNELDGVHPAVWMMDAASLNQASYGDWELPFPWGEFTCRWLPWSLRGGRTGLPAPRRPERFRYRNKGYSNQRPIAIIPKRTNPRIVGQQGMFTVHGTQKDPVDLVLSRRGLQAMIYRFDIVGPGREELLRDLRMLGITRTLLFPELSSVAVDLKNSFGFVAASSTVTRSPTMAAKKKAAKKAAKKKATTKKVVKRSPKRPPPGPKRPVKAKRAKR